MGRLVPSAPCGMTRTQLLAHGAAQAAGDLRAHRQAPLPLAPRVQRPAQHDAAPAENVARVAAAARRAAIRLRPLLSTAQHIAIWQ